MSNYRVLKNDFHDALFITSGYVPVILLRPALFLCEFCGDGGPLECETVSMGVWFPDVSEERFFFKGREVTVSYHLFSLRGSVQDYKIHMDVEIVVLFA